MALARLRLLRHTAGATDTVHFETSSSIVMRQDNTSVETALTALEKTVAGKASLTQLSELETKVTQDIALIKQILNQEGEVE